MAAKPAIGKQKAAQAPAREPVFFAATNGLRLQATISSKWFRFDKSVTSSLPQSSLLIEWLATSS